MDIIHVLLRIILIFSYGQSKSGKTYTIQCLLQQIFKYINKKILLDKDEFDYRIYVYQFILYSFQCMK